MGDKKEVYFGTDGIRGEFGRGNIHPDFLVKLAHVVGRVLHQFSENGARPSVVIGKDTRLSGYIVESCLEAGFNAAGVDVYLLGVAPTPAISHLTRSFAADLGVVVSASHNPFWDNGVKFFAKNGNKLSGEFQEAINEGLHRVKDSAIKIDKINLGKSYRIDDAQSRYVEFCKGTFPYRLSLRGLSIVLDCANGAAWNVAPKVFSELGAKVDVLFDAPDGVNINENCGSTHPEILAKRVIQLGADAGIAFDGDADRVIMVDKFGKVVDGDKILYVLAKFGKKPPKGVVGTLMSNMALERALQDLGIEFVRAPVGDRYVMEKLIERNLTLGGEPSGHILCLDKASTGDAIVATLQVLAAMVARNLPLHELVGDFMPMPQTLINVRVAQKVDLQNPIIVQALENARMALGERGRVLLRASGTEPVVRVMVEGMDSDENAQLATQIADTIKGVL